MKVVLIIMIAIIGVTGLNLVIEGIKTGEGFVTTLGIVVLWMDYNFAKGDTDF